LIAGAIGNNELPMVYLLGEKYVDSIQNVAKSPNSKTVVLPADLPNAIKGMLGK
jgi:hypothetical protein